MFVQNMTYQHKCLLKEKNMLRNLWKNATFYCLNHDKPVPLYVIETSMTPFYACPKYMLKDETHPNGHEKDESGCGNHLSFQDSYKIMEKFNNIIEDSLANEEMIDFTGLRFKYKSIQVKILKYSDDKIDIGITNSKIQKVH